MLVWVRVGGGGGGDMGLLSISVLINSTALSALSVISQVRGILDAKGKVGMGVDGSSSNETVNLLDDCRIATYLQRSGGNPKGVFGVISCVVDCTSVAHE